MENNLNNDMFLLISGNTLRHEKLTDQKFLYKVLKNLPLLIGMNTIRKPLVSVANNNPGLEGYVPIDESNITISTYTNAPRIVACIHSCNEFDAQKVVNYLKKEFVCSEIKFLIIRESDFKN